MPLRLSRRVLRLVGPMTRWARLLAERLGGRRALLVAAPLALAAVVSSCSFAHVVRAAARQHAALRHVDLEIRTVRPGWFAVRLLGVAGRPEGMPSVQLQVDEIRVNLGFLLGVQQLDLHGVRVDAHGALDHLRDEFAAWRALGSTAGGPREPSGSGPTVVADGVSLRWLDGESTDPRAEIEGMAAIWEHGDLRWSVKKAHARQGVADASLEDGEGELDRTGVIVRARASALTVNIELPAERVPAEAAVPTGRGPLPAPAPGANPAAASPAANPATPLVPMPDLPSLRTKAA